MKTTLLDHLSLGPYKESVTSVQIQMPFHAVGRSFRAAHMLLILYVLHYSLFPDFTLYLQLAENSISFCEHVIYMVQISKDPVPLIIECASLS